MLDCDDTDASINPDALDISSNGIDEDCSGADETGLCTDTCSDADDGFCDDGGPNADFSICVFGTDCSDCDPRNDSDGDGYYDNEGTTPLDSNYDSIMDCDDTDPSINVGATDIPNDGIDQDCSGSDLVVSTLLCDDSCQFANDGVCDDGGYNASFDACDLGTDCSDCGDRYDDDGDGYDSSQDCNDSDPTISPAVSFDSCDGVDSDCNNYIDDGVDTIEPNNSAAPYYLGDLNASGDSVSISTYMTYASDEDAFSLFLYDNTDILPPDQDDFTCEIVPPAGMDIEVELLFEGTSLGTINQNGVGGTETFTYDATWLTDDEGTYTFVISSSDTSCSPITVSCEKL